MNNSHTINKIPERDVDVLVMTQHGAQIYKGNFKIAII